MFTKIALATVLMMATFGTANAFEIQKLMSRYNQAAQLEVQAKQKFAFAKRKVHIRKSTHRRTQLGATAPQVRRCQIRLIVRAGDTPAPHVASQAEAA